MAWQAAYDTALNQLDDSTVLAQQSQRTAELVELGKQAGVLWRSIKYFVQKAFPNNAPILAEFGSKEYYDASRKNERMVMFLDELLVSCNTYEPQLTAVGLPANAIADLGAFRAQFQSTNTEQEMFKRTRLVKTQARVDNFNALFLIVNQVVSVAAIIFTDDAARRSQYVFNPGGSQSQGNDPMTYTDTVAANELREVAEIPYLAERLVSMENTGTVALEFYLSVDGNVMDGTPIFVGAGATVNLTMGQIANAGDKFMVMNNHATACSYVVVVN